MIVDRQMIRDFLISLTDGDIEVGDDDSLLESGVLDSLRMVELLGFIEERFGVSIDDEELVPENFETINAIVALLETKESPPTR